jgi:pimeloyl-ACP methyl ester carboxylesterase
MFRRSFLVVVLAAVLESIAAAQTGTPREDRFFNSSDVKIRYVDVGRGEPVVLIHGFSSSLDGNWGANGIIDTLAKEFRVVALDCRGHGKSDKPHDASSYGSKMADDVARLLDHVAIRKAHIVGYSMGGVIAGKFIATYPDRAITAVFGGAAPRVGWTAQNDRDVEELASSLEQGPGMRPLFLRLAPPNEPKPSEEIIEQQSRAALGRNDALALAAVQRGFRGQTVTVDEVKSIRVPMPAVIGAADPIKMMVDAFKTLVPALKVIVLDVPLTVAPAAPRGARNLSRPCATSSRHTVP